MVKHTQTIHQQQSTNCLSVFDHFVGLALKGLKIYSKMYSTSFANTLYDVLTFQFDGMMKNI